MAGAEYNRQKRLHAIADAELRGMREIGDLTRRDKFLLGLGLYWGEGAKFCTDAAAVANSDPAIILFAMQWMQECLGVKKEDFSPYVYISEIHALRKHRIIRFCSHVLKLPMDRIRFILLRGRSKKVYENHNTYYGVCALLVRKGTNLKYRILGLLKAYKRIRRGSSVGKSATLITLRSWVRLPPPAHAVLACIG